LNPSTGATAPAWSRSPTTHKITDSPVWECGGQPAPGPENPSYGGVDFRTAPDTSFFWSGKTNGVGGDDFAREYARAQDGTTLEMFLDEHQIVMPEWLDRTPGAVKAWTDAPRAFAWGASGNVRVLLGEVRRPDNVFEADELPVYCRIQMLQVLSQLTHSL
jgi:hypothetical protein